MTFTRIATLSAPVATFLGFSLACGMGDPPEPTGPTDDEYVAAHHAIQRALAVRAALGDHWGDQKAVEYVERYLPPPPPTVGLLAREELSQHTPKQISCFAQANTLPELYACGMEELPPLFPTAMGQLQCLDGSTLQTVDLRGGNVMEKCAYSDGEKHGWVAEWTPDGRLLEIDQMDDRRKVGISAAFHEDGGLRSITDHSYGKDRFSLGFHANGNVSSLAVYPNSLRGSHRLGVLHHMYSEDGSYFRGTCKVFSKGVRLDSGIESRTAWTSDVFEEVLARPCP
jgi:hypothetical protein